jgi:type IV secretion system protein VirD4
MGYFDELNKSEHIEIGGKKSNLGRGITSIESAKEELFFEYERTDPKLIIKKCTENNLTYYGEIHNQENESKSFTLKESETTMEIFVGSTGTGKGVLLGNKALEAIYKKRGLIIIDPKRDAFLPQICLEALTIQNREDDFQVVSWPDNFGYMGINEFDNFIEVANKFIDALGLEESDNPGVDYYRKNSRVILKKILKIFFEGSLGVLVKKEFIDILNHVRHLKEDLEKADLYQRELAKPKPNNNLLQKYEKRYFDPKLVEALYWDKTDPDTLDSLSKSLAEIAESGNIFKQYDLTGALYEGKVLYFKVDMLDVASLKMIKLMITDAIQQSRRKNANTTIIADELSFYANKTISGALATVRSMGLKFLLALQDLAQIEDGIREAILSNCNVKVFYKISDQKTLEYVQTIGGQELVTNYSTTGGESKIAQAQEDFLNPTRIRALPRQSVAIIIAEALNTPVIVQTNYIAVSREFIWDTHDKPKNGISKLDLSTPVEKPKEDKYKIILKEEKRLLEDSDIFAIEFDSEELL